MKRCAQVSIVLMFLAAGTAFAHMGAGFPVKGTADTLEIDPALLPQKLMQGYRLYKETCTVCHSQERIVRHLQDSYSKGADYEADLKKVIARKIRMAGSDVSTEEGKEIWRFLLTLFRLEVKKHGEK